MQNAQRKSSHVYDYAIIGSGLSGLAIANALGKISSNIVLIESADSFGGFNRSIQTPFGPVNNGLRFLPDTDLSQKAISFLEMLLMTSVAPKSVELPPMTFEAGGLKNFVGFGDQSPAFYDEITYFTAARSVKTNLEPHEWTQILNSHLNCDFMPRSYVTKFHLENDQITQLTINGQKNIQALNFIYCGPMKSLRTLLPEGALSHRAMNKMTKNHYWTAVCLDLLHGEKQTEAEQQIHVLNGTTQDDLGPCVGMFHAPAELNGENLQYSQWMTFIDDEEAEDTELVGAALKKMKRQIKRAYPQAFEKMKFERILVVPSYSGDGDLKLSANQTLPGIPNFWVASAQAHHQRNILGSLLQAELVTSALGCHPMGHQVEISETAAEGNLETLS